MHVLSSQQALYLNQIEAYVDRLPSLSTTATKVLATCNDPQSSPNDLNRLIALDPLLAGQVLKLVNSAYYSLRQPVSSLTRAIIMLGVNTVKNLVLSLAILDHLRSPKPLRTLSNATFWSHSVTVGVIAKRFADVQGVPLAKQEDYFVSGLLHDLGKIPLNDHFTDEYVRAMVLARKRQCSMDAAERTVFGIDHSTVGGLMARKWRLSRALVDVLANHHRPEQSSPDDHQLVPAVALANFYAQLLESGADENALSDDPVASILMARVGIDGFLLRHVRDTVLAEIDKAKIFLEITQKGSRT